MTREEIIAYQADLKAFRETEAGSALFGYESALGKAWITDQRETSSRKALERDWAASDAARAKLVEAIKKLQAQAREAVKE